VKSTETPQGNPALKEVTPVNSKKTVEARKVAIASVIKDLQGTTLAGDELYAQIVASAVKHSYAATRMSHEDATQEGWLAILERKNDLQRPLNITEAATTIVHALDKVKSRERRFTDYTVPLNDSYTVPPVDLVEAERKEQIADAFDRLDKKSRAVLRLRFNLEGEVDPTNGLDRKGLSQEKTAEKLKLSRQEVRTIEQQAMQTLRQILGDKLSLTASN
jgi:RNA polymerase sigma factor (sigma-70 family)